MNAVIEQMELFPPSSRFNSTYALRKRHNEVADRVKSEKRIGAPAADITGQRFGSLVIVCATSDRQRGGVVYVARCDCGREIKVTKQHVERMTTHCGCKGVGKARKSMPGSLGIAGLNSGARHKASSRSAMRSIFAAYRQSARKRGFRFDISRTDFLEMIKRNCHYCGAPPSNERKAGDVVIIYNGIDRVDSSKGYSIANCVPCCRVCNIAKNAMSVDDFRDWVKNIYHNWVLDDE